MKGEGGERAREGEIEREGQRVGRGVKEEEKETANRRAFFHNSRSWNVGGRCHIAPNSCCSVGTATGQPKHLLANPCE